MLICLRLLNDVADRYMYKSIVEIGRLDAISYFDNRCADQFHRADIDMFFLLPVNNTT